MSDALQAALNAANERISQLSKENSARRAKAKEYRAERDSLAAQVTTLTGERDGLQTKLTTAPSAVQKELDLLKSEVRTGKHKAEFERVAKDLKVRPEALGDLWTLAGYKAETDLPDPEALKGIISPLLESRSYLVVDPAAAAAAAKLPPGPGADRGAPVTAPGVRTITQADLAKATNPAAQKALYDGLADGSLVYA